MSKDNVTIILSLIFWIELTVVVILAVKLLIGWWRPDPGPTEKVVTPAMIRKY